VKGGGVPVAGVPFDPEVEYNGIWYPICEQGFENVLDGAVTLCKLVGLGQGSQTLGPFPRFYNDRPGMQIGSCWADEPLDQCSKGNNHWGELEMLCNTSRKLSVTCKRVPLTVTFNLPSQIAQSIGGRSIPGTIPGCNGYRCGVDHDYCQCGSTTKPLCNGEYPQGTPNQNTDGWCKLASSLSWLETAFVNRTTWNDYPALSPDTALRTVAALFLDQFKGPCTATTNTTNPYQGTSVGTYNKYGNIMLHELTTTAQQDRDCCAACTANPECEFWVVKTNPYIECLLLKDKVDVGGWAGGQPWLRSAWRAPDVIAGTECIHRCTRWDCKLSPIPCTLLNALNLADVDRLSLTDSKVLITFKDDIGEAEVLSTVNAYNEAVLRGEVHFTTTIGTLSSDGAWVEPATTTTVFHRTPTRTASDEVDSGAINQGVPYGATAYRRYVEGNYNANGGNGEGTKYSGLNVYVRNAHAYNQVATGTKCSSTDSSKQATCSNGDAGNCGQTTLAQCADECTNADECTHFSHLDPSGSDTCIICRELPDESWSGSTTYSVSAAGSGSGPSSESDNHFEIDLEVSLGSWSGSAMRTPGTALKPTEAWGKRK
jgi:hypothetical protein